ncbi:MAG: DNA polymerase III subunit alpha [Candidatus Zixiibacteriota bacterium]|nr:MAG: DNA polymerase III subunit alpha [candidate division Zixibacteria bacterium]
MNCALPVCRSSFSLLCGTASPESLVSAAGRRGFGTLVLADRDNLYGCYDFYHDAREHGLKPIIGAELRTGAGEFILLCENHDGFRNLSRLVTHSRLQGTPTAETVQAHADNLLCLAGKTSPPGVLKEIFADRLYFRVDYDRPSRACRIATENNIKAVAMPLVSFLESADYETHRLLRAIGGGYLLEDVPASETARPDEYLRDPGWYRHFFAPFSGTIFNCSEIAERCNLNFPQKKNILPDIAIDDDHFERLRKDAFAGLQGKKKRLSGIYLSRLEYELSVIRRTGFVDYFLIINEILQFCRENRITAAGRGSAAGSLVSYGLDITRVDPIREGLYFERFLNEARSDCPDVDLDIDWRRRDDVLDFIYRKYGEGRVAMMASYIRFQPRLALRETAKAMGFAPEEIDRFVKRLPRSSTANLQENIDRLPFATRSKFDWERFLPVLRAARSIAELPRHLSIHAGGIVITPGPLTDYIPLERAAKGIVVTQCDMYQAEKIGLVKIDILGQRGLAVIADCLEEARKLHGNDFEVPENDPKTYQTLRAGKTIGIFQIESPGLRALLRVLKPRELNDITLALALIRPGASESGMKKVFLNRFHGRETTEYPHPNLQETLRETYGVFIYQEQVLLAGQKIAGFNMPASDLLRRAITKKRKEGAGRKLTARFLAGALRNGVDEKTAGDILAQLRQFASFGFCKAHAATYGHLAYLSAYFKTHYPGIFMKAVLRNGGGYYPPAVYVAEARRIKVEVRPPDIRLCERFDSLHCNKLYLGLTRVRDITGKTLAQIENARPFHSLADFLSRVDISEREVENLIRVGFFDSFETSRPRLLWQYRLRGRSRNRGGNDLFGDRVAPAALKKLPDLEPYSRFDVFRAEKNILDIPASFHPLSLFAGYRRVNTGELARLAPNAPVSVSGWLADRKRIKTRDGKSMVFLTFDSLDDTFEVVLFPDIYDRVSETIRAHRYLTVAGRMNFEDGTPAIIAQNICPAKTGLKESQYI